MPLEKVRRFTYGDQFDPVTFVLTDLLELCVKTSQIGIICKGQLSQGILKDMAGTLYNEKKTPIKWL